LINLETSIRSALIRPGNITFPANLPLIQDLSTAGGRVVQQPGGHLVFYGPNGKRVLATDPDGNPLHECEWKMDGSGHMKLLRARVRLDWGQWVGLKPEGIVNRITLDLSKKPGWERLQADDLRQMAAQAMHIPFEEVRFFYSDDDLIIDASGRASIRHKKDALYVLEDGTFSRARFMSCIGAMHWTRIDFLPVVELFQSLLPSTGSAVFELIRGLYDDQNESQHLPLRYRGIPTYPSESAFQLFSRFFVPHLQGGDDPFPVFMNVSRAHEVTWLPVPDPPVRYFDPARHLCVTIKGGIVQKVTVTDDSVGLPFVKMDQKGFAPFERSVEVTGDKLILKDREKRTEIPVNPSWCVRSSVESISSQEQLSTYPLGWRALFGGSLPQVTPFQAFSAVLLYPDDGTEIEEAPSQRFVMDHLQDAIEQQPELASYSVRADRVLIHNLDAAANTCISLDRPRDYTILYHHPEFAQKQAQLAWNRLAQASCIDWAKRITFLPAESYQKSVYEQQYDIIYLMVPFLHFGQSGKLHDIIQAMAGALQPGGLGFIVGPHAIRELLQVQRLRLLHIEAVETLPSFRMHKAILPNARLKAGLTLLQALKV